ncbi:isovaleryl-CoA dehydrogenase [Lichenifustis flavocetrariae]|uniref:Isovaleryl-CoA dehydrogenase n=1 Tax=Lichenifustis flavocetrariae TaxID=2949735 RepID=A0AA41YZL1_9HYPH|nr:isovaleryl-CoA dehydrogenase [Lichenifustis flavocetrariae]MCW6507750.1 isovaleryl-CoA dehydrogenase [Lichenifustis flavocetrariae]
MSRFAPTTILETHEVTNQPSEFAGRNLYSTDRPLREAVLREAGEWLDARMGALGAELGADRVMELGDLANRFAPELVAFDRYGRRIDEVRFHPAYHELMAMATRHEIHDVAWTIGRPGARVAHAALLALFTQIEAGTMCPINMTYAAVPALQAHRSVAQPWLDRLIGGRYDAPLRPIADKTGITIGMAMTEKQGGSDVRANTTRAERTDDGSYRLVGHKWFCSAPTSDGFLTLAQAKGGLSCFLAPRITPEGERNAIHVMRLKDKLGNRSNASSEIEYHGAHAMLLGEEGRGVNVILEMVHHTRLGTVAGTIGTMRMALAQAVHHVSERRAFQRKLIDQPLMRAVIADLAVEYEAAVVLAARVARAFDKREEHERAFARLSVALAKYWLTKRNPNFIYECMECHGGVGYVEETPMPRLFRESPLNAIWEGSGNVIALDVLRTLACEPRALEAYRAEVATSRGGNTTLDAAADALFDELGRGVPAETRGRLIAERMALTLQGALLVRNAPAAVADAFCATRLGAEGARSFGVLPTSLDIAAIVDRQTS